MEEMMQDTVEETLQDDAANQPIEPMPQEAAEDEPHAAAQKTKSAPGWIKRRIEEGVRKETAALEMRLRREYEDQLLPLREAALSHEADELVRSGEFKSRTRAEEYLRLKHEAPKPYEPARQEAEARARDLFAQAQTIRVMGGPDMLSLLETDPVIRQRVLTGQWDFIDAYENVTHARKAGAAMPFPVRSANGGASEAPDIRSMTSKQLSQMNESLRKGNIIDFR